MSDDGILVVQSPYDIERSGGSDPSGSDPYLLTISNVVTVTQRYKYPGDTISIEVSYLKTPLLTQSTQSFRVYSRDPDGYIINQVETEFYITMLKGKTIEDIKLTSQSLIVGQITMFTFDLTTPVPMVPTDQIRVMYPN